MKTGHTHKDTNRRQTKPKVLGQRQAWRLQRKERPARLEKSDEGERDQAHSRLGHIKHWVQRSKDGSRENGRNREDRKVKEREEEMEERNG